MVEGRTAAGGFSAGVGEIGIILVFIIAIILLLPYILKQLIKSTASSATSLISEEAAAVKDYAVKANKRQLQKATQATYHVTPTGEKVTGLLFANPDLPYLREYDYEAQFNALPPVQKGLVGLGNVVSETAGIDAAAQGAALRTQFEGELAATPGETARFNALDSSQKLAVRTGEGFAGLIGVDPYQAGRDTRAWWDSLWSPKQ